MHPALSPNINSSTVAMLKSGLSESQRLGLSLGRIAGANVVQFASDKIGTKDGGVLLAKICFGGAAKVTVVEPSEQQIALPHVAVSTVSPLVGCIGCQYAGWPLEIDGYFAMASGPVRLLRGTESVLEQYGLLQTDEQAVIVLESSKLPTESAVRHIAVQAGVATENLYVCIANTSSLPGTMQVVSRSVETAMHKLHELGFDLATVQSGQGTAPLPPSTDSDLTAMGWTNDAMLYGAKVELTVDTADRDIEVIIDATPSSSCSQFGKPFLSVFNEVGRDFYAIDPLLFAPAEITIKNLRTGNSFSAGCLRIDILQTSFEI